ncbi:hypothetical protein GX618_03400 [Candidatus Dojkabacteria bacterium]|uniref:Rod shape-determining protein MreD n=1 Tax=Candidatus Dojkabacteria bacterium TaxID=2099670 RepID=A0A847ETK0_9BACT|nr:hypothetical protein [Candidatus Dojkabacteria bacterium]HRX43665.1 hypothetical protein [Candidatus Dojkabacteria bacterium]
MIEVLLIIISIFVLLFLESFLFELFSFSILILVLLLLWKRINPVVYYILITFFAITLDSVNHFPLGTHVLVISILLFVFDLLSIVIPSEGKLHYLTILLSTFLYYILLLLIGSLLQDGAFPKVWGSLVNIAVVSGITTILYAFVNRFLKSIQYEGSKSRLTLD